MDDFSKQGRKHDSSSLLITIAITLIAIVFLFPQTLAGKQIRFLKLLALMILAVSFPWVGVPLLIWVILR